ncbi:hypothetical protein LPW26_05955 [Rhodopseudomonas sp. HC1]|uniref:hypothetical protein n=1 Tax=Rhodopseudomonas infernalis TaxID=2897386 RepID=UPI001EE79906|nr:hypothetical protein [Rhodopseudomonas infernalis]MCG6204170.1 hypothetical protein [Rhodopseudomonas infernalis]
MSTEPKLPTRADWDAASPYEKGVMSYKFAHWDGSEIPASNPFPAGSGDSARFDQGAWTAMLCTQDFSED